MSYLLDALKESQRRRDQGRGDPLFQDKAVDSPGFGNNNAGNSRKYLYLATLVVALGVLGGWFYASNEETPGGDALAGAPSADVAGVEEGLVGRDTMRALASAVEPEQPEIDATAPSPVPEEAIPASRDLTGSDATAAREVKEHAGGAGEVPALAVAAPPGPVAAPDTVPAHRVARPVRDASVEEPPQEQPSGEDGLPGITPQTDVSGVEVALGGGAAASATVQAVEPEMPADNAAPPAPEKAVAESRDLAEAVAKEEREAVAVAIAQGAGPGASADNAPSHGVAGPVQEAAVAAPPAAESDDSSIPHFKTLPLEIQQEIGPMNCSVHFYSRQASKRFVTINGAKSREGDRLANGVHLESIVSSGAIFSYKGYRFWIPLG